MQNVIEKDGVVTNEPLKSYLDRISLEGKNILISGQEKIGKTFFLKTFVNIYKNYDRANEKVMDEHSAVDIYSQMNRNSHLIAAVRSDSGEKATEVFKNLINDESITLNDVKSAVDVVIHLEDKNVEEFRITVVEHW